MHHTPLLRARAFVFEDQPLGLILAGRQTRLPEFLVVIELHFQKWEVAEDVFRVLRHGAAVTFQSPGQGPVVWLRSSRHGRDLSGLNRG